MMRVSKQMGLSGGISFDTSSIAQSVVNAVMPAIKAQMPAMINAAMPTIQASMPSMVASVLPTISEQVPGMVMNAMPAIVNQMPSMVDKAMPLVAAKLPAVVSQLSPLVRRELEISLDQYAKTYLGPAAQYKEWAPALMMIASSVSLFASGIIIYRFWSGE